MHLFARTDQDTRIAAVAAAIVYAGIALFQAVLAAGAPLGEAAWGGAHTHLSTGERVGSAVAVFVWTAAALIVLGRAGLWAAGRHASLFRSGTWLLVAVNLIAALMDFASQSRWENAIFGPTALVLALLCTVVARSGPAGRPREHGNAARAMPH
jgi:hypothetical protein